MFENLLNHKMVKRLILSVITGICIFSPLYEYSNRVMADITNSVVRLHIIANSDSKEDQLLKIKVRNDIIDYLSPMLDDAKSTDETKNIIKEHLDDITIAANKSIKKHGYTYSATAVFGNYKFPEKEYENIVFPSGNYDALRIVIGNGSGKNWWCVLYPQLCFSQSPDGLMSDENQKKLKNVLTEDEYELVSSGKVNFKLKIAEWFFKSKS
ncbi:MAG: stage II sporulation protein R [Clostridia bacterium]|nr:stage II sporulation protein R [Clostridia bacterium]